MIKAVEQGTASGLLKRLRCKVARTDGCSLIVGDAVLHDPVAIHDALTAHLARHFRGLEASPACERGTEEAICYDEEAFRAYIAPIDIPLALKDRLWKAMQEPMARLDAHDAGLAGTPRAHMAAEIRRAPSFAEFSKAIACAARDSAGGMSGVTYNALKCLDEPARYAIWGRMAHVWDTLDNPASWKHSWAVMIPKASGSAKLEEQRPVVLLEPLRKIWMTVIVRRIQQLWERFDLLQPSQHGYRHQRGTESAVLQVLNIWETAAEACSDLLLVSWDIEKAFDAVTKDFLIVGWVRLGVPLDVATYMVSLDVSGRTVVRTSYALSCLRDAGPAAFSTRTTASTATDAAAFERLTGCGQGDIPSPLNWVAYFDLLLTALRLLREERPQGAMLAHVNNVEIAVVEPVAYADDVLTADADLEGGQATADTFCAACSMGSQTVAARKLCAMHLKYGDEGMLDPAPEAEPTLRLHTFPWRAADVELLSEGNCKHLGYVHDAAGTGGPQLTALRESMERELTLLGHLRLPRSIHLRVIEKAIFPAALYRTKFSNLSLTHLRKLDSLLNKARRKLLHILPTHPTRLLEGSPRHGGIGCQSLAEETQWAKLGLVARALQHPDPRIGNAVRGLFHRALRKAEVHTLPGQAAVIDGLAYPFYRTDAQANRGRSLFFDSVVEHGHELGLDLSIGGYRLGSRDDNLLIS
jgi:hypothetical protein